MDINYVQEIWKLLDEGKEKPKNNPILTYKHGWEFNGKNFGENYQEAKDARDRYYGKINPQHT
jgi:hypothetical protein